MTMQVIWLDPLKFATCKQQLWRQNFVDERGLPRGFGDKRHCSEIPNNAAQIFFQKPESRQNLTRKKRQFATTTSILI